MREILMVASENIKTPSVTVPFLPNVTEKQMEDLRISLNKVTLANVLEEVKVSEKLEIRNSRRGRIIRMRFEFLPPKSYKNQYGVRPRSVLHHFENEFVRKLLLNLSQVMKDKKAIVENDVGKGRRGKKSGDKSEMPDKTMDEAEKGGFGEGHASSDEEVNFLSRVKFIEG